MNKHRNIVILMFLFFITIPIFVFAQFTGIGLLNFNMPFGGRVLTMPTEGSLVVTCVSGFGPFTILPINSSVPGPYFINYSKLKFGTPQRGGMIMGLYNTLPDMKSCYNTETGVPIPVFSVKLYGSTIGFPF